MKWTKDQQKVIDTRDCNLLVSAAAGSGKTAVLVERIIEMISDSENPINVDELLVVTFTKAAAAQMRDKIAKAIENRLEKEPHNEHFLRQLNLIHQANILTIDSFCYQVVKEHFYALHIDPGINIGDSMQLAVLRSEVLEEVIESFYQDNEDFVRFSDVFSADKNDDAMEDYILRVYQVCSSYPRPKEWTKQARKTLLVQTKEEFNELGVVKKYIDEVHSCAQGIRDKVQMALEKTRQVDGPFFLEKAILADVVVVESILSAKTYVQLADLLPVKWERAGAKKGEYDEDLRVEVDELRKAYKKEVDALLKAFAVPIEQVLSQMQKQAPMFVALLDAVDAFSDQFMQQKLAKNMLEFSDVEHFALDVLCEGYDEDGMPIPSLIGREMAENFKEILIDEYQDSNYLQEDILQCVSTISQGKNNMFMVGDVKQSIYSFRMARPDLFMHKYNTYEMEEGQPCQKILLKKNFRSRSNVLQSINYLFYQIMDRDLGGIAYTEDEALDPGRDYLEGTDDSVELLLGESKNFTYLSALDEAETSEKDEDLDEDLEDIGKQELEASMVAKRIAELMGNGKEKPHQVVDDITGQLRDVTYSDIVILFRSHTAFEQVFYETLTARGIPVQTSGGKGYLESVEIRLLVSLLKVIDNPYIDVELAAILRGYFGHFSSDELAIIFLVKRFLEQENEVEEATNKTRKNRKMPLYDVLCHIANLCENEHTFLEEKCADFYLILKTQIALKCQSVLSLISRLQDMQVHADSSQIISEIYYREGYYYYVQSMPQGAGRARNLDAFLQVAIHYANDSFCSVYALLKYVKKLQEKEIATDGESSTDVTEQAVRIMSIHKSKGLEFPVVFLSGLGKGFNLMDTKSPLIIHSDYYLGAKYRDLQKRCGNDTFVRQAIASLMITESIAEELRLFYVGLTRAKEKLILTGVTSDIPKLIKKYEHIPKKIEDKLSYANVHMARNYLDFVVMGCMRNRTFYKAMNDVRKRMDKKGENIVGADYEAKYFFDEPQIHLKVFVYDFESLLVYHLQSDQERFDDRENKLKQWSQQEAKKTDSLLWQLQWEYENLEVAKQKTKMSVTEIQRLYETDFEPADVIIREHKKLEEYQPKIPQFISEKTQLTAAQRGTFVHKAMELFDFVNATSKEAISKCLLDMRNEERIPEELGNILTDDKMEQFVKSSLGQRMVKAAQVNHLYKEKQFVIGAYLNGKEQDPVVVQGIIDAYFEEDGELVLVDYKTDQIQKGQEEKLVNRYALQLRYYKETLEQLTGMKVKESYLYSFALDAPIRMPDSL